MVLAPGPYEEVSVGAGRSAPFYTLRYDAQGRVKSPLTLRHLVEHIRAGATSDVYVMCHGWNNDFERALEKYRDLTRELRVLRETRDIVSEQRPVFVGIFWPSTAMVAPWEQGPDIAAAPEEASVEDLAVADEVAADVDPDDRARFYELAERASLDQEEAREFVAIVAGVGTGSDDEIGEDGGRTVDEQLTAWAHLEGVLAPPEIPESPDHFGGPGPSAGAGGPMVAGFLDKLNPRNLLRLATVRQMKDRAGIVGSRGVGDLLAELLGASATARLHLVGHSYGARVLMTAIARREAGALPRPVRSLLMLQPAVNHLCFAPQLPDGRAGGLRDVPALVELPILSTFSAHDFPLTRTFHLALRRGQDLGEVEIASAEPPSRYAALGGYGPRGYDGARTIDITDPVIAYELDEGAPALWAVDATRTIKAHGDVVNPSTAWALHCLASA